MIIELVGLPGAGKSTYARRLASMEKFSTVKIRNRTELIWFNTLFALRFPVKFFKFLFLLIIYRGPRSLWYTKLTSVFLDYNAKYMKARRFSYAILDQGHLQVFLSLFEREIPEDKIRKIMSWLPKADHYVVFKIDETIRLQQLAERGYQSRFGLIDDNLRSVWQMVASNHFNILQNNTSLLAPATFGCVTEQTNPDDWVTKYHTAIFMRYITFVRMPTEKAHGLQIAKMCEAFTKHNVYISLVTPKRSNNIRQSVNEYYSLGINLQHKVVGTPDVIGRTTKVTPVHHYLHELFFSVAILFSRLPNECVIYTRTPLIAKVANWRNRKAVVEQHYWPKSGQRITAWLLKEATIIANSEGTATAMSAYGLQPLVAHNGFPAEWLDLKISKAEARQALGLATDLPVVMYVGSLHHWKGVDTLCKAGRMLADKVEIVVIGGSDTEVQQWKKEYPEIIFLGNKAYQDLGDNQQAADVLVVPNNPVGESEQYTSPIKLFAHLASGIPVVVSDLPPMHAIVDDQSVWFFNPGSPESLADVVMEALSSKRLSEDRSSMAKHLASKQTWSNRASNIIRSI